jgi:asparagine N-glycosylation enzyme membrane subunit Stt3
MSVIVPALIALLSIILPGFFLALALLRRTKLNMIEISIIGFIFGLIFPPVMTWLESYLIDYIHAFSFSAGLYGVNVIVLTILGIALCVQQGAFSGFGISMPARRSQSARYSSRLAGLRRKISELGVDTELVRKHEREEEELAARHAQEERTAASLSSEERERLRAMHAQEESKLAEEHEREERLLLSSTGSSGGDLAGVLAKNWFWILLIALMLFTFYTRMLSMGIAANFFEFDPYFDMQSTMSVLTFGSQYLYDTSAWPTAVNGTPHRIEPIVPYLESYWYDLSASPGIANASSVSTTLLSDVGGVYPPITAALLVFIIFFFLYHGYGEYPAVIGAGLATAMPALITTFIAGEQLLEPWGIFAMFLFYAVYLLAAQHPKELRYAVLAGIAYAASFLGAHYYTVIAGVFAIYILLQGAFDVLRNKDMKDFYRMNIVVIAIITAFFVVFDPYGSVLADRIPGFLGMPVTIAFPLMSLVLVALFEYVPLLAKKRGIIRSVNLTERAAWLAVLVVLALLLILFTPLGNSVKGYLSLSTHFTTPSIPLFMTVQEYAPTGINFDFGAGGFGIIGASVGGINLVVLLVLVLFTILAVRAALVRDSKFSILAMAAVWPLAVAGMIEVKYLPHFGVAYILAIGIILGELLLMVNTKGRERARYLLLGIALVVLLLEFVPTFVTIFAAQGQTCTQINNAGNSLGFDLFCNTVPQYWLNATAWMRQNVGPYGSRILSWWDYGDWINWFGNSNAVLRGDNAIALLDYQTAARYVLGTSDGYGPSNLASFMNNVTDSKYVLFDNQLTAKWQALDFLGCVGVNQTSKAFAIAAGQSVGQPYLLGTSTCELNHDPAYLLVPISTSTVSDYCQLSGNVTALRTLVLAGNRILNQTYCAPTNFSGNAARLLTTNGSKTNILLVPNGQFYAGVNNVSGQQFLTFIALYEPNAANGTVTDAPTEFYQSNYYKAFYLGQLPGFKMVYPTNFTGMNYVNGTWPVVIYALDNYTGPLPKVQAKDPWVANNYTMPG